MHDEELAACGVRSHGSCHGDNTSLMLKVILDAVSRELSLNLISGTSHACALRVSALNHEAVDDSVENETVIEALLNKRYEILYCDGCNLRIEL